MSTFTAHVAGRSEPLVIERETAEAAWLTVIGLFGPRVCIRLEHTSEIAAARARRTAQ